MTKREALIQMMTCADAAILLGQIGPRPVPGPGETVGHEISEDGTLILRFEDGSEARIRIEEP